ncbi:sulfurtransferase [Alteribacter lacisalsi]|uniref:Sulfurtransferase n=1 Tax=Alteribacter lacisalsi TaxID=2045244 RepID=A0A2W0H8P0_9BACI|nr:sulfurtransferase [Alteribacter lacisalsi]PYZ98233.1 sulfurtransferase [Alteribacter lacisalsi]
MTDFFVSSEWLKSNLQRNDMVIVDCRFDLADAERGKIEYSRSHIPGAVYAHLDNDLSAPRPPSGAGGRHPLPDLNCFQEKMGRLGIDNSTMVVAYDDQGGAMASRLWWLLTYTGHKRACVLSEPFSKWLKKEYPVESGIIEPQQTAVYHAEPDPTMTASMEEVKQNLYSGEAILIDSRAPERFAGVHEPIDHTAGHIPTAVNDNWQNRLDESGNWKSEAELRKDLSPYEGKEAIVYCGSGVTACANVLAFKAAGKEVRLYPGSWSEWITRPDNPVNKG